MFDLWAPKHSQLREKTFERLFLAELSKTLLLERRIAFEVLRSEFDASGYDVVVTAGPIMRHIQLKVTRVGGKRRHVDIHTELSDRPGGCVIWMMANPETLGIGPFYWLGGEPGAPLIVPDGKITRHSKANASGVKAERQALRNVSKRHFHRYDGIGDVADALFGPLQVAGA
ncbi:hypothetical protein L7H23_08885 [Sphingopyxis sp. BSN-002]|uniref:hypothetical protein n=1 Tax=Sphingopyxis sp. BSN-002 TaxID=2911495 RepID=UPI001EDAC994|nr:hypothetical protein [Sphingopyxis sp. BSN-002]UKK86192.1 hypothetical protein L7H23_08885 [Sphingopyxis sp. BSN-002]